MRGRSRSDEASMEDKSSAIEGVFIRRGIGESGGEGMARDHRFRPYQLSSRVGFIVD